MAGETRFFQLMGMRQVAAPEGVDVAVEMDVADDLRNTLGILQGGVTATLADVAGGRAAKAKVGEQGRIATADLNVHYLAPARVGPVRAEARVVRAGRTAVVTHVDVYDAGAGDRLVAIVTMTSAVMPPR